MRAIKLLLILLIISKIAFAADDDVNIPDITNIPDIDKTDKHENSLSDVPLKISGILDGRWQIYQLRKDSPYYKLNFYDQSNVNPDLSLYMFELYLNGDYSNKNYGLHIKTHSTYIDENNKDFTVYEGYNYINIGSMFSFEFGKKIFGWGKGYALNPVGYFNPKKDVERPELAQEGILASNIELTKSFDSDILKTFAFTFVVVPPSPVINDRYGELEKTEYGAKLYFLFLDTDVDFLSHYIDQTHYEYGFDLSRNIGGHFEVHGELNYFLNKKVYLFENDAILNQKNKKGLSCLGGFRFVPWYDVTIISEYYHNDAGLSKDEYIDYLSFIERSYASNDSNTIQKARGIVKNNLNSQTLMKDYIYLKITKIDLFGILYLSISPYILFNIRDKSFIAGPEISYNPFSNFEVALRQLAFIGNDDSEYGSKQNRAMYEFEMKVHF